jgi:cobalamin biosynthesis protein CobW
MTSSIERVPCTIITGFLGSGKTTLVRNILQNAKGKRLAVIVNEFGDVGIDGEILKGCGIDVCPEENVVELANGCLCCTVADDFVPALDLILAREPRVDHILIETSGLALPKPLVQAFQWPSVRGRVTVDGVVAVVDGEALANGHVVRDESALAAQRAADISLDHDDPVEEVFEDQIACADLVIVTKRDLLDEAGLARADALVGAHLPRAVKIIHTEHGEVEPLVLLGLGLAVEDVIDSRRTHHDDELDHDHDEFDSLIVPISATPDPAALVARVTEVSALAGVLRIKGFADVPDKPLRLLVQAVGRRVNTSFERPWATSEMRQGQLVIIGLRGLDHAAVKRVLAT